MGYYLPRNKKLRHAVNYQSGFCAAPRRAEIRLLWFPDGFVCFTFFHFLNYVRKCASNRKLYNKCSIQLSLSKASDTYLSRFLKVTPTCKRFFFKFSIIDLAHYRSAPVPVFSLYCLFRITLILARNGCSTSNLRSNIFLFFWYEEISALFLSWQK